MKSHRLMLNILALTAFASSHLGAAEPQTKKVDPKYTWDTTLLYPTEDAFKQAKAKLATQLEDIKKLKGHLGDSSASLLSAFETLYGVQKEAMRLSCYASFHRDENLKDTVSQERSQELDLLFSNFMQAASFIDPELLTVGEAKLGAYLDAEPKLAPYRFYIRNVLRSAPHTLGAEAEGVMAATSLTSDTPHELYSILSTADVTWPTITLSNGSKAYLDQAGYTKYRAAHNRDDRKAVYEAFWPKYAEYQRSYGTALLGQVKQHWFTASVRKYPNCLSAALAANNVPETVYRTLVKETNANLPTLHRYLKLRARMLGISDLRYWDMYPPLVQLEKTFPYEEAKGLVSDAVAPLGKAYVDEFKSCIDGRYTHVYPQAGKRSGAYSNGSAYDVHNFVLLNYNDDYESVSTFAHEWGHGMHSQLANRAQPFPTSDYAIFVAEIASTCNEALLLEHMLKIAKTDEERLYYLGNALEGLRTTYFRQAMFAEFELAIHEEVEKGNALSGEKLTKMYGELLRRYHGQEKGVMKIDDIVDVEWAYIPHFYYNFYVYQYATSIAASQDFAEKILNKEPGAVETYLNLLKSGGSDYPYELVKRAGVDLASPEPYRALATRMNKIMDQIESILDKQKK